MHVIKAISDQQLSLSYFQKQSEMKTSLSSLALAKSQIPSNCTTLSFVKVGISDFA